MVMVMVMVMVVFRLTVEPRCRDLRVSSQRVFTSMRTDYFGTSGLRAVTGEGVREAGVRGALAHVCLTVMGLRRPC